MVKLSLSIYCLQLCGVLLLGYAVAQSASPFFDESTGRYVDDPSAPEVNVTGGFYGWESFIKRVDHFTRSIAKRFSSRKTTYNTNEITSMFLGLPVRKTSGDVIGYPDMEEEEEEETEEEMPDEILHLPLYGYWSDNGWNLRLRGFVYRHFNLSERAINRMVSVILLTSAKKLPPDERQRSAKLMREIFSAPLRKVDLSFRLRGGKTDQGGELGLGLSGEQNLHVPRKTNWHGDYDSIVPLNKIEEAGLVRGDNISHLQAITVSSNEIDMAPVTSYLVPPRGTTFVCDIDDILRVSRIWKTREVFHNLFARPYRPWMNMPEVLGNWSKNVDNAHFHYLTVTPVQLTRPYMSFVQSTYPEGTFDARIIDFKSPRNSISARRFLLDKVFKAFPQRKFVLLADNTNRDIMKDYPSMVSRYPGQVQCILVRNVSATEPSSTVPYNTKHFKSVPQKMFMFFRTPDDVMNIDFKNGGCYNDSVPQNLTYGWQNLPFGLGPP